jgi:proteasome lid subunit RPN8/RPN11
MNHFEVVGLLAADPAEPGALRLAFLRNRATVPGKWELRKTDITAGRRVLEGSGLRAVGLFHSHPVSPAKLGLRDRRGTPPVGSISFTMCARSSRDCMSCAVAGAGARLRKFR